MRINKAFITWLIVLIAITISLALYNSQWISPIEATHNKEEVIGQQQSRTTHNFVIRTDFKFGQLMTLYDFESSTECSDSTLAFRSLRSHHPSGFKGEYSGLDHLTYSTTNADKMYQNGGVSILWSCNNGTHHQRDVYWALENPDYEALETKFATTTAAFNSEISGLKNKISGLAYKVCSAEIDGEGDDFRACIRLFN